MLRQASEDIQVQTRGRGLYEITVPVQDWLARQNCTEGLLTLHLGHTSASLLIQENADPDVRRDLDAFFERLVPDRDPIFFHTAEGADDMSAHVRTALTSVNLSIPLSGRELALGAWQGIYLWEHRTHAHSRVVRLHFIGE